MKGGEVIEEGMFWGIGQVENVNIWADMWYARIILRCVILERGSYTIWRVADLIGKGSGFWNVQLAE